MSFDQDVFISYAHIDNRPLAAGQEGWVSALHRALAVRLAQLRGADPRIWRDPKLQGNDYFGDQIVKQLPSVGALLLVLSPRYVQSEWCVRELREFCRAAQESGGLRAGDRARIFPLIKTPVPVDRRPDELKSLLGYEFYRVDAESGRVRELHQEQTGDDARRYWACLDDLAYDLCQMLETLASPAPASPAAAAPGTGTAERVPIYLAETSFDLRDERDAIRRDLLLQGHTVLPDRPLPLLAPELRQRVAEDLAHCRLSVHMIGRSYGLVPEGTAKSIVELQKDVAVATPGRARLIWMPPSLAVEDERQQRLIAEIVADERTGADVLAAPLDELKIALEERLRPAPPAPSPPPAISATPEADLVRIYLICDPRDLEALRPLADFLYEEGHEVILPAFEGDEAEVRLDHQENLRSCDAVLLYYGAGNELWLRVKLRDLQKIAGYGRTAPLAARAIYVGAPKTPQKEQLRTREALVLPGGDSFSPEALAPFLAQLDGRER